MQLILAVAQQDTCEYGIKENKKPSDMDDLFEIPQGTDALDIPCQGPRTVKQLKAEIKDAFSHSLNSQNWKID